MNECTMRLPASGDNLDFGQAPDFDSPFNWRKRLESRGLLSLLETAVLFAALLLLDAALPQFSFGDLAPHPFWLPVIFIAAQFGTMGGLLAALMAITLSLTLYLPLQGVGEDYYHYLVRIWSLPALWLLAGIVIGELRQGHLRVLEQLRGELHDLENQRQTIATQCVGQQNQISALQHHIATSEQHTSDRLLDQLLHLSRLDLRRENEQLGRQISEIVGPCAFTVYEKTATGYKSVASHSDQKNPLKNPQKNPLNHDAPDLTDNIRQIVGRNGRYLFARNRDDITLLDRRIVFAGPLRTLEGSQTHGILVFNELPVSMFTERNHALLQMVCAALGRALAQRSIGRKPRSTHLARKLTARPLSSAHRLRIAS